MRWSWISVAILLLGSGWIWATRVTDPPGPVGYQPAVDYQAPDFALLQLGTDTDVRLHELRGRPVVLNFWATWCGPCRAEMPMLQEASVRYGDAVTILGVDQGEEPAQVARFTDELGITFPILLDESMAVSRAYHILGLPTTFFIDGDGVIRRIYAGELTGAILADGIQSIAR